MAGVNLACWISGRRRLFEKQPVSPTAIPGRYSVDIRSMVD